MLDNMLQREALLTTEQQHMCCRQSHQTHFLWEAGTARYKVSSKYRRRACSVLQKLIVRGTCFKGLQRIMSAIQCLISGCKMRNGKREGGGGSTRHRKLVLRAASAEVAPSSVIWVDVKASRMSMRLVAPLAGMKGCPKQGLKVG